MAAKALPVTSPTFKLTAVARQLLALRERAQTARIEVKAIRGPDDLEYYSDASPEWLAARDRLFDLLREKIRPQTDAIAERALREVIQKPLSVDSLVTLAAVAESCGSKHSYAAAKTLAIAVMHLAGDTHSPLDKLLGGRPVAART